MLNVFPSPKWYLIHGDFSVPVISDAGQAEACQVHGVFRQILGDGVGVCVFELWEPVQDALVFPHGVALHSKDLDQQDFGVNVGHDT